MGNDAFPLYSGVIQFVKQKGVAEIPLRNALLLG